MQKFFKYPISFSSQFSDRLPNQLVSLALILIGKNRQHFEFIDSIEQRLDHRLNRNNQTFESPRISPRFEIMGRSDMMIRFCRRLIRIISIPDDLIHALLELAPVE